MTTTATSENPLTGFDVVYITTKDVVNFGLGFTLELRVVLRDNVLDTSLSQLTLDTVLNENAFVLRFRECVQKNGTSQGESNHQCNTGTNQVVDIKTFS
jgi:hypothetical protein